MSEYRFAGQVLIATRMYLQTRIPSTSLGKKTLTWDLATVRTVPGLYSRSGAAASTHCRDGRSHQSDSIAGCRASLGGLAGLSASDWVSARVVSVEAR